MSSNFDPQPQYNEIEYKRYIHINTWQNDLRKGKESLHILHLNICSLRKHFNELLTLTKNCLDNIDIICLTEVNVKKYELCLYNIEGFNLYSKTREKQRGGGIVIYVKENITFKTYNTAGSYCELLHGCLQAGRYESDIIVCYRPPKTDKPLFIKAIEQVIRSVPKNKDLVMIGDYNIDILEEHLDYISNSYLNVLSTEGLHCGVQDVTREAVVAGRRTVSCIDHVFVRTGNASAVQAYVLRTKVADHFLTGLTVSIGKRVQQNMCKIGLDNKIVQCKLNQQQWSDLLKYEDPISLYEEIKSIFCNVYDSARLNIQPKKRENQPWVSEPLLKMMEIKDSLFRKWKTDPSNNNFRLEYTKYRNKVQKSINKAKNNYKKKD